MPNLLAELGGAGAIGYITEQGIDQARALPGQLAATAGDIAGRVGEAAAFTPYAVTTGSGTTNFTPEGMTQTYDPNSQQTMDLLRQQAMQQAGSLGSVTPESLMQQMSALRAPQQARDQQQLDNRLAAQGRLGIQTNAYGGTPEQLAMQKAIQEQQSMDSLSAIQGARQLQSMDINNLTGMLNAAGIPQQQMAQSLNPALTGMQLAQNPRQLEAQAIANMGQQQLQGIPSAMNAEALMRQAQMTGMINLLGLGGQQTATGNSGGQTTAFGNLLGQGANWLSGLFDGGGNSISDSDFTNNMISTGGGSGSTSAFDVNSFVGNLGAYDPNAEIDYFGGGGGVNLPPTTIGGGGI